MRQCSGTNLNINEMVGVLPIRIVKSNVSSLGPSSERNTLCLWSLPGKYLPEVLSELEYRNIV